MGFTVFWQLVQVGVAQIVANLVTLRPVFQHLSPESVLGSLRSKLSISSLREDSTKQKSEGSSTDETPLTDLRGTSSDYQKESRLVAAEV